MFYRSKLEDAEYNYHMSGEYEISKSGLNALYLETKIRKLKERQFYYENLGGLPTCPDCGTMLTKLGKSLNCLNYHCNQKVVAHDQLVLDKS